MSINGIHHFGSGKIQNILISSMGNMTSRSRQNPVRMLSIEIAVLVDHFRLKPETEFHAFRRYLLRDSCNAIRQLFHKLPGTGEFQGFDHLKPGDTVTADKAVAGVDASAYSALLLPGGVAKPDLLRADADAVAFVRAFFDAGKPVAAICHAPWLLIEAGVVEGRRMTAFESIRTDLKNAGADVVDEEVVVDQGLVTSRCPDDIPAFNARMIEEFAEGRHAGQSA